MPTPQKRFFQFHGRSPVLDREVTINDVETLIPLGRAIAIEYEIDKLHGGGDGKMAVYRHEFETPALVCMDQTGRKMIYVIGKELKVTEAGIEN